MKEASKTRKKFGKLEEKIFINKGIDIGCGDDPVNDTVRRFDKCDGDADKITKYVKDKFHYVFSAHCLEHMKNPKKALLQWWELVEEGGYLYTVVPDEDLYEQGNWPSIFNKDHKYTFTISKSKSWSPKSINIGDLIKILPNCKVLKIELQDDFYDYSLVGQNIDQTRKEAMAQIVFVLQKQSSKITRIRRGGGYICFYKNCRQIQKAS